jgi:hypothetical protein
MLPGIARLPNTSVGRYGVAGLRSRQVHGGWHVNHRPALRIPIPLTCKMTAAGWETSFGRLSEILASEKR